MVILLAGPKAVGAVGEQVLQNLQVLMVLMGFKLQCLRCSMATESSSLMMVCIYTVVLSAARENDKGNRIVNNNFTDFNSLKSYLTYKSI